MSRRPKRIPQPTSVPMGTSPAIRYPTALRNQAFSRRLVELMREKVMSQSDLAKAAFGMYTDRHGVTMVRGRDRISSYIRGIQYPDDINLGLIANALGVTVADLTPKLDVEALINSEPEFNIHQIPNSARVLFIIQKDMKRELASDILALMVASENPVLDFNIQQIPDSPLARFTMRTEMDQELAAKVFTLMVEQDGKSTPGKLTGRRKQEPDDYDADEEDDAGGYADEDFLDLRSMPIR